MIKKASKGDTYGFIESNKGFDGGFIALLRNHRDYLATKGKSYKLFINGKPGTVEQLEELGRQHKVTYFFAEGFYDE